jgi:hypothetical protein
VPYTRTHLDFKAIRLQQLRDLCWQRSVKNRPRIPIDGRCSRFLGDASADLSVGCSSSTSFGGPAVFSSSLDPRSASVSSAEVSQVSAIDLWGRTHRD